MTDAHLVIALGLVGVILGGLIAWEAVSDFIENKRYERDQRKRHIQADVRLEERIVAVGDEAEAFLAREHPLTVGDAERYSRRPFDQEKDVEPAREPNSYFRMVCPGCGAAKDAWTDEAGDWEDYRDAECRYDDSLPCFGKPLEVQDDD